MKKSVIFLVVALVLIIIIFLVAKTGWLKINVDSSEDIYPNQKENNGIEYEDEGSESPDSSLNIGGGISSSDEGSSGGNPISEDNCEMIQISYSLKNFASNQLCLQEGEGVCIRKQINCTIDIYNLDEISGEFELNLIAFNEENYEEIKSLIIARNVMSHKFENLFWTFDIESEGIEGDANKVLGCSFETASVPKKEICF